MKTVQKLLNEVNEHELVDTYFAEFPIDYEMIPAKEMMLGEIKDRLKSRLLEFIRRMKELDVQSDDRPCVFFACKQYQDGAKKIGAKMCHLDDICTIDHPECYSWLFVDFAKVMGYFIADTDITRENICIVLAQILYEMSFFGYTQADMEEERKKLEDSQAEVERGEYYTSEEVREHLGLPPKVPDPEAEALERDIRTAEHTYNTFCRNREIMAIKALFNEKIEDKSADGDICYGKKGNRSSSCADLGWG